MLMGMVLLVMVVVVVVVVVLLLLLLLLLLESCCGLCVNICGRLLLFSLFDLFLGKS